MLKIMRNQITRRQFEKEDQTPRIKSREFEVSIDGIKGKSKLDLRSLDDVLHNIFPEHTVYYHKTHRGKPRLDVFYSERKKYITIETEDDCLEGLGINIPVSAKDIKVNQYAVEFKYNDWVYSVYLQPDTRGE